MRVYHTSQGLIPPPQSHLPYSRPPVRNTTWDAACYKLIAAQFPCCKDQTDGTCRSALFVVGRLLLGSGPWLLRAVIEHINISNTSCWGSPVWAGWGDGRNLFLFLLLSKGHTEPPILSFCHERGRSLDTEPWWITAPAYLFLGTELVPQEPLSLPPLSSTSWLHCLDNNEEPSLAVSVGCFVQASAQKDSCWSLQRAANLPESNFRHLHQTHLHCSAFP